MEQLHHFNTQNTSRKFPITLVCDAIRTPANIGMIFRVAESFGISKIYLHSSSPDIDNKIVKRTARNTIKQLSVERYDHFESLISTLKTSNTIIGIELTDESVTLSDFDFSVHENIVLVLGSERYGIQNTKILDYSVQISMYGLNTSINVVNSLAITLYEVTNQLMKV